MGKLRAGGVLLEASSSVGLFVCVKQSNNPALLLQGYGGSGQPHPGPHPPFGAMPPQGMYPPQGMPQHLHRPPGFPPGMSQGYPGGPRPGMPGMMPMHMGPPPGFMGMPYGAPPPQYGMPLMGMRPPPEVCTVFH